MCGKILLCLKESLPSGKVSINTENPRYWLESVHSFPVLTMLIHAFIKMKNEKNGTQMVERSGMKRSMMRSQEGR